MPYYPKSQVKTNLYANFGEYLINSTGEPYQGFYWKNSKNEFYTGRTPNDVPAQQLTPTFDPVNEFISPVPANPISEVVTTDLGGIKVGQIMNIYVNMFHVLQLIDNNTTDGELSLIDLLTNLCSDISLALGGVNSFEPFIEEETNTIKIIDQTPLSGRDLVLPKLGKKLIKDTTAIQLYGYKSTINPETKARSFIGNFVRNYGIKTELTNAFATTVTIGAQARGAVVGENSTALSKLNEGLIDRLKPEVNDSPGGNENLDSILFKFETKDSSGTYLNPFAQTPTEEETKLAAIVKIQELRGQITKEQIELENKLFMLDLAQRKGRDIATIQAQQAADKDRLGLEYRRYMLTQNQYNLQSLQLDNVTRLIEAEKKYNDQKAQALYEMERQGSTQEARENYEQRIKAIEEVRDIELQAIEDVNNARTRNAEADVARQKSFVEGWGYAARKFREDAENAFARGERAFGAVMSNMDAAIGNFVETGKFAFEDFAVSVIKDLIRMEMQAQATMLFRMLIGSLGGFSMSKPNYDAGITFNPGEAATGGEISGPTIVGENGPELFIPSQRGTVIPNTIAPSMAGMGQPQVVYNGPYIENMSAIDTQSAAQFLSKNKMSVWAANKSADRSVPVSR